MKESREFYLGIIEKLVEERIESNQPFKPGLSQDDIKGMHAVFDDYLFSVWINLGDTAFNRLGYRNATDDLLEHLAKLS